MNLVKKLRPGSLPTFDYGALGDPDVEQRARAAVVKIHELQRAAVVEIGRTLLEMKEVLPHGQFLPWVESFGLERRTATNYMQVAAEFGSKWAIVSHLPAAVLYKLAAPSTPPAVREAVMHIGPGQIVSMGNVQELIDSVKTSEVRKNRRDHREEIQKERDAHRAKWEARDAKDRLERDKKQEAARDAAERARFMLGGYFPELCELMRDVSPHLFADELDKLMQSYRVRAT